MVLLQILPVSKNKLPLSNTSAMVSYVTVSPSGELAVVYDHTSLVLYSLRNGTKMV